MIEEYKRTNLLGVPGEMSFFHCIRGMTHAHQANKTKFCANLLVKSSFFRFGVFAFLGLMVIK
ncbi:hypothetical protein CN675_05485 [Bacillus toyonensis]|nr:hypothetical protein COO13_30630 [Bacillus toyonensis]PEJ21306.1 hypothetical protein CN675_05485 [Bacillus toyonensis]PEP88998.1 hypothetical protein CN583_24795 [Bacillus toyonensis]PFY80433.1 hypothetical protein COL59_27245 [Bacillus toyonensis]PGB80578.1 hypothetical protein COM05_21010 [Bacillus toyonensis]